MSERAVALLESRPITGIAFRLAGDEWLPWLPSEDHRLYKAFHKLQVNAFGQDYAEQKVLLERLHEAANEDVYVASFDAIHRDDDRLSYTLWIQGITCSLPRAQFIVFAYEDQTYSGLIPWEHVVAAIGDLMQDEDVYPVRFRVTEFPSEQQRAELLKNALAF